MLLFFAILDFIVGSSLINPGTRPADDVAATYRVVTQLAPYPVWGGIWVAVGLVCLVQAWMKRDAAAFALAIGLKVAWSACFATAYLLHPHVAFRGWYSALVWASFAAAVGVMAGWPEPLEAPPEGHSPHPSEAGPR